MKRWRRMVTVSTVSQSPSRSALDTGREGEGEGRRERGGGGRERATSSVLVSSRYRRREGGGGAGRRERGGGGRERATNFRFPLPWEGAVIFRLPLPCGAVF